MTEKILRNLKIFIKSKWKMQEMLLKQIRALV